MTSSVLTVLEQTLTLFLFMAVGILLYKRHILEENALTALRKMLLYLILPCALVKAFMVDATPERYTGMMVAAIFVLMVYILGFAISYFIYRKKERAVRSVLLNTAVFANCSFMGFPLILAVVGQEGLIYGAVYLLVTDLLNYTVGIALYPKAKGLQVGKLLFEAPVIWGLVIGLLLFITGWRVPEGPLLSTLNFIEQMTTPVAMLIIGGKLAQIHYKEIFSSKILWGNSLLKLLIFPLLALGLVKLFSLSFEFGVLAALFPCFLQVCCPSAASNVILCEQYGGDTSLCTRAVALSTLLCLAGIPLMIALWEVVF